MSAELIGYLLGSGTRPLSLARGSVINLGRDPQNTIVIDDALASRRHATIDCHTGAVVVKDLCSRNSTFVNDKAVSVTEPVTLKNGDSIRVGGKVFYFISAAGNLEPQAAAMQSAQQFSQMQTLDSGYYFKDGKVLSRAEVDGAAAPPAQETQQANGVAPPPAAALAGTLSSGGLPQILQFLHANAMSGRLFVKGQGLQGALVFRNGQLLAATTGPQQGAAAVYACAREREGHFTFDRLDEQQMQGLDKNVTEPTVHVIFECCRQMDEAGRGKASGT